MTPLVIHKKLIQNTQFLGKNVFSSLKYIRSTLDQEMGNSDTGADLKATTNLSACTWLFSDSQG